LPLAALVKQPCFIDQPQLQHPTEIEAYFLGHRHVLRNKPLEKEGAMELNPKDFFPQGPQLSPDRVVAVVQLLSSTILAVVAMLIYSHDFAAVLHFLSAILAGGKGS
jgi:hypothetical protein